MDCLLFVGFTQLDARNLLRKVCNIFWQRDLISKWMKVLTQLRWTFLEYFIDPQGVL